jgi:hypothetical protein
MKLRLLIVLACASLAVSACMVAPYGGGPGGYYRGEVGRQDYARRVWQEDEGRHDYGRSVWRE